MAKGTLALEAVRMKAARGFTLVELMMVVAIIGLLASIALPSYHSYAARAQVTEAMELLMGFKSPLGDWYGDRNDWPTSLDELLGTTTGKYVGTITGSGSGSTYTLIATMKTSGINPALYGHTMTLVTTDGGKTWDCTGGTILTQYRPTACR
jgi:type IV pilus assembly protein PilA